MSEKSRGKRVKVPDNPTPRARPWLPDGGLASGVEYRGSERAAGLYTTVAKDAKMEILDERSRP